MDWLWTNEVAPFSFALLLMFGLGVIELVGQIGRASCRERV